MACRKITFSVPENFVLDLDYLAKRLKVTRSAMLTEIAAEAVHDLRLMVETVPENPNSHDLLHAKGKSKALIEDRIDSARRLSDDLFSE